MALPVAILLVAGLGAIEHLTRRPAPSPVAPARAVTGVRPSSKTSTCTAVGTLDAKAGAACSLASKAATVINDVGEATGLWGGHFTAAEWRAICAGTKSLGVATSTVRSAGCVGSKPNCSKVPC